MPSPNDAWRAIERRLASNWTDTPIAWPGVSFTPPNNAPWIRPTPMFGDGFVATYQKHIVVGVLQIDVFGPKGQGYGVLRGHAEALRDLCAGQVVEWVRFGAAGGIVIGQDDAYAHVYVRIPFEADEARQL